MQSNFFDRRTSLTYGASQTREIPLLGSNRLDYAKESIGRLSGVIEKWKDEYPASITCRLQTLHLSPIELRLEDYFLMRKDKLRVHQMDRVKQAVRSNSFNDQLLKCDPQKLPPISQDKPLQLDSVKQLAKTSYVHSSNSNNAFTSNSNNIFSRNSHSSSNNSISQSRNTNVFMSTSNNSQSSNIFGRNESGANSNNSRAGNIFSGNSNGNTNKMFNSNNNSSSNGNVFSNNNSNNNNNSIFGNNNSNNNSLSNNNIFNRGGTSQNSNNNNNNIFGNSSNNNSNNVFTNNNNNSNSNTSNPFNQMRNNNQITSNTIFNNQNNNNGNNNFNNSNSSSYGNSLFNNGHNSSACTEEMRIMMTTLNSYLSQTHQCLLKFQKLTNEQHLEEDQNYPMINHTTKKNQIYHNTVYELPEVQNYEKPQKYIILRPEKTKLSRLQYPSKETPEQIYEPSSYQSPIGKPVETRYIKQQSSIRNNSRFSQIQSISPNYQASMIHSRKATELKFEGPCLVSIRLEIQWLDIQTNKESRVKTDLLDEVLTIQADNIEVDNFDLESQQGRVELIETISKELRLGIRTDAILKVDRRNTQINYKYSKVKIVGRIKQKLININPQYQVTYRKISKGHIYDLTISRKEVASVAWDDPIPYKNLDFQRERQFALQEGYIDCRLPELQSPCRVTFKKAPEIIRKMIDEKRLPEARNKLKQQVLTFGQGVKFGQLWQTGEWGVIIQKGFSK